MADAPSPFDHALVRMIRDYWYKRGYDPEARLVEGHQNVSSLVPRNIFVIASNMINGVPTKKRPLY